MHMGIYVETISFPFQPNVVKTNFTQTSHALSMSGYFDQSAQKAGAWLCKNQ